MLSLAGAIGAFAQLVLITVFALSAVSKVRRHASAYPLMRWIGISAGMPRRLAVLMLVALEGLAAALLVNPKAHVIGYLLSLFLLGAFTAVLCKAVMAREYLPCGCFGDPHERISSVGVLRNVLLMLLAAGGLVVSIASEQVFIGVEPWLGIAPLALAFAAALANIHRIVRLVDAGNSGRLGKGKRLWS